MVHNMPDGLADIYLANFPFTDKIRDQTKLPNHDTNTFQQTLKLQKRAKKSLCDILVGVSLDLSTPTGMACIVTFVENRMGPMLICH